MRKSGNNFYSQDSIMRKSFARMSTLSTGLSNICIEPTSSQRPLLQTKPNCRPGMSNLVIGAAEFSARFKRQFSKSDPIGVSLCKQLINESENFDEDEVISDDEKEQYPAFNIPNVNLLPNSINEWCESRQLSKSASNVKLVEIKPFFG